MDDKTITALKQQKRNPSRINVYLDGEFAFGLEKIVAAWLSVGAKLSTKQIRELESQEAVETAYQRALHFISYRPRSIQEVRVRLTKKEIEAAIIEAVIERLVSKNYLNDEEFAQTWVENRVAFKPRSRFALRGELIKKGISEEIIEAALASVDDASLAYKAAESKARRFAKYDRDEFRKKLLGFLGRRGFSYAVAEEVCRELWAQQQSEAHTA